VRLPALQHPSLLDPAAVLPHAHRLSLARSTTAAPPHPEPLGGRCAQPTVHTGRTAAGQIPGGSRVHCALDEGGAQLCPCGIAVSTPQTFPTASRAATANHPRSSPTPSRDGCAPRPAHIHQVRAGVRIEGRNSVGSSRTPLRPARRTRTIWQY
jgi:hypothetical protein